MILFFFKQVDIIFSELSFSQALLPWDNLYFYYGLEHVASLIQLLHRDAITVLPRRMRFYAIAVSLENLDKIRSPVQSTEGFDIREFDKVILVIRVFLYQNLCYKEAIFKIKIYY